MGTMAALCRVRGRDVYADLRGPGKKDALFL